MSYSPLSGKWSSFSKGVQSGSLGQISCLFSQSNYGFATLSYSIPKIIPSLDSLVILNFILKSRPLIFIIIFWVLRYIIPPPIRGVYSIRYLQLNGFFPFLIQDSQLFNHSQVYQADLSPYIYNSSCFSFLEVDYYQDNVFVIN